MNPARLLQPWVLALLAGPILAAALVVPMWLMVAARETRLERDRLCLELYQAQHGPLAYRLTPPADPCGEWRAAREDRRFVRVTR